MTIYIILIALLNLGVGYFAAVKLGLGRAWWSVDRPALAESEAVEGDQQPPETDEIQIDEPPTKVNGISAAPIERPAESKSEPITSEPSASAAFEALASQSGLEEQKSPAPEEPTEEALKMFTTEEKPTAQAAAQEAPRAADDARSEPAEPSKTGSASNELNDGNLDDGDLDDGSFGEDDRGIVEACVADFKRELEHYRAQLGEIESQVRDGSKTPQAEQLQECADGLKSVNREFLDKQGGISRRLKSQEDHGQFADVAVSVGRAMAEQEALVGFSNANIEKVDVESDLETGYQRLLGETSLLMDNAGEVEQTLQSAETCLAEIPRDRIAQHAEVEDPPRGYEDVKQALNQWWNDDPERTRKLTVGIVGVDNTEQLVDQIGDESSGKLFDAVRNMLQDAAGERGSILRHSPHVFVVLFHDTGAREATNVVEQVRQGVAAAKFAYRESLVPVTVSCAVTPAGAEDGVETIVDRIDATLKESSRYGENQTFLHEDDHPAPVVPPQLDIVEVKVRL